MKKLFSVIALLALSVSGFAQDVDNFEVGPYEVDYKGSGDYKFRLRNGVDLYEYFDLKKDTLIQILDTSREPLRKGIQIGVFMETSLYKASRYSNSFGFSGEWKQGIANKTYFNGGLALGIETSKGISNKENILELGFPLSLELSNIDHKKASLYGSFGITPAYYTTIMAKYEAGGTELDANKYSGLYIAPRIDFGGYIPIGHQFMRIGIFYRYKINCSKKDYDIYYQHTGRSFFGANVEIIF